MPEGAELEIARIDDLPLINPDLEETVEGGATRFPPSVERLRQQVAAADAIFFATPEYNYSVRLHTPCMHPRPYAPHSHTHPRGLLLRKARVTV